MRLNVGFGTVLFLGTLGTLGSTVPPSFPKKQFTISTLEKCREVLETQKIRKLKFNDIVLP